MTRKLLVLLLTFLLIFVNVGCTSQTEDFSKEKAESTYTNSSILKVHFIDVGQADSILIDQNGKYMLIDAGNNADSDLIIDYLKKQGVKKLEYVVGTHPHEDHIGSLDTVINTFEIGKVLMPKVTNTTKTFEDVINAIKDKGLKITTPKVGDKYTLDEGEWIILAPNKDEYEDFNNYSIVIKYVFGNHSFLFTGDAEKESEEEMLLNNIELKSDVLKIGHHGSNTSTTDEFLEAVNPSYGIICVGQDNKYKHPHEETIDKLIKNNVEILRTDKNGTIIFTSDGKDLTYSTEN
ncbi:ComEC/Rec2 family competence protein [Defluviitalea phaphyphila]|uniref:ComEC/Rec2 family competence protein n=1 Tax=Defluviitalea phaphyphila TaxID=1473580 RepID=UPI00073120D9|nr:ComEC/Rec2 family competence protein [Defluviitalea phaphyphila]